MNAALRSRLCQSPWPPHGGFKQERGPLSPRGPPRFLEECADSAVRALRGFHRLLVLGPMRPERKLTIRSKGPTLMPCSDADFSLACCCFVSLGGQPQERQHWSDGS